jgi:hypothetical protein
MGAGDIGTGAIWTGCGIGAAGWGTGAPFPGIEILGGKFPEAGFAGNTGVPPGIAIFGIAPFAPAFLPPAAGEPPPEDSGVGKEEPPDPLPEGRSLFMWIPEPRAAEETAQRHRLCGPNDVFYLPEEKLPPDKS